MAIDALVAPLLRLELFQGLRPLQLTEIVRRAERIVFKPGQTIVTANSAADAAFVIMLGQAVRTEGPGCNGDHEDVPTGSLIGEMAMLVETEYSSTVVAQSAVRAIRITRAALYDQMAEDPRLAEHMVARITTRLKALAADLRRIDDCLAEPTVAIPAAALRSPVGQLDHVRPGVDPYH